MTCKTKNNRFALAAIAFLLSLVMAVAALGCGGKSASSGTSAGQGVAASSSAKSDAGNGSDKKTEYSMKDIKNLKNVGNFEKNALEHIFSGTINKKGKATGFHYSRLRDSKGKIVDGTRSKEDKNGVFTGKVEVDGVRKEGFSSFYPESFTPQQVVDAINTAYEDALSDPNNPRGSLWIGHAGKIEIDMYLTGDKKIITAFPVRQGGKK